MVEDTSPSTKQPPFCVSLGSYALFHCFSPKSPTLLWRSSKECHISPPGTGVLCRSVVAGLGQQCATCLLPRVCRAAGGKAADTAGGGASASCSWSGGTAMRTTAATWGEGADAAGVRYTVAAGDTVVGGATEYVGCSTASAGSVDARDTTTRVRGTPQAAAERWGQWQNPWVQVGQGGQRQELPVRVSQRALQVWGLQRVWGTHHVRDSTRLSKAPCVKGAL
jgi:hypothetical protein